MAGSDGMVTGTDTAGRANTGEDTVRLSWLAPAGLIGLSFWNFFARLFTLGIYYFWGKTEVRKRLWAGTRLNGEPLVYTGTGRELFLGFLIIFFIVLLPVLLLNVGIMMWLGPKSPVLQYVTFAIYAMFFFLFGVAVYRAQRYRLSRTRWRGIRGAVVGSSWQYGLTWFWTGILVPFTLGWILPWRAVKLQKTLTDDMRFGSSAFRFEGGSGPLYKSFAVMWFVTVAIYTGVVGGYIALGWEEFKAIKAASEGGRPGGMTTTSIIMWVAGGYAVLALAFLLYAIASAWYRARVINHFASCTRFEQMHFRGGLQARGLIYIAVTNFFIRLGGSLIFLVPGVLFAAWAYAVLNGMEPVGDIEKWDKMVRGLLGVLVVLCLLLALFGYGLFSPVTEARTTGYLVERIHLDGTASLDDIAQGAQQDIKTGEGLAEAFDIDAF